MSKLHNNNISRFRTAINVLGDSIGAGIVYHLSKDELDYSEELKEQNGITDYPEAATDSINLQTNGEMSALLTSNSPQQNTVQNGEKMRILVNPHTNK